MKPLHYKWNRQGMRKIRLCLSDIAESVCNMVELKNVARLKIFHQNRYSLARSYQSFTGDIFFVGQKIIHHPYDRVTDFEFSLSSLVCFQVWKVRSGFPDLEAVIHFQSDSILVYIDHGKGIYVFSGAFQGISNVFGFFSDVS